MDEQYFERARIQALKWAEGHSYHEPINDECCPDFSCCYPELFNNDPSSRWEYYAKYYSRKN